MGVLKYGVVAVVLAGGAVAGATSLPSFASSGVLQSGNSLSASCQTSKLSLAYQPDTLAVYLLSITVSNIDSACGGKYITVAPVDKNGNPLHASTHGPTDFAQVPSGGGSVTLTHFANTYASQVDHATVTFSDNPPSAALY